MLSSAPPWTNGSVICSDRGLGADGSDLLNAVITAMTISRPARGAVEAADRFRTYLPVWLRPLAVTVTALAVDGLRVRASDDPAAIPDLATWLNNLANRLSDVGRRQEALRQPARPSPTTGSSPRTTPPPTSPTWPGR